ncbi:MAG TPA: COX15/CtaA family protein [Candidatus Acidoferrum sp.]|nr:COX15/CtaA family protein [Candidatus Acidoferrum sp.]
MAGVKLFRRLAVVTAIFAYLQIALGGVVRVTGSGLGCPDWPLCHGRPYPPANLGSIIEYSHRAVGSVTELLIALTAIFAWVVWRSRRPVVAWLASASLIAGLGEALLGAGVVANELASWLVLIHLAVAMIILGFLVATVVMSMPPSNVVSDPGFRRLAAIAAGATYLLLLTGSSVVASGADATCRTWPLCGSGFTPDFNGVDAFTMLHRGSVLLIGAFLVFVLVRAARIPGLRFPSFATLAIFALQVAVGAGAAVTDGAFFNGLHVAFATLVWAGVLATAILTLARTDRDVEPARMIVEKGPA